VPEMPTIRGSFGMLILDSTLDIVSAAKPNMATVGTLHRRRRTSRL
jgi:hypothetical protein